MRTDIIDVQAVENRIVACPNCGQRNRTHKQDRRVNYRCGSCGTELPNPFAVASGFAQNVGAAGRFTGSSWHRVALVFCAVVALVVVGFILLPTSAPLDRNDWRASPEPQLSSQQPAQSFQQVYPIQTAQSLPPPRSLANGASITELSRIGKGTLKIDNGTGHDAVIKVVDEKAGRAVVAFYVCAGRSASIERIPDGYFRIIFASGTDWDAAAGSFTRDKLFAKFDKELDFVTTQRTQGYEYSVFTLTLHRVVHGNAKTTVIGEDEFLKY
jgi:hypothetical protein